MTIPSLLLCGLLGQLGCESNDAQACRDNYQKAHALIAGIDNNVCAQSTGSKFAYSAYWGTTFSNANGWAAGPK